MVKKTQEEKRLSFEDLVKKETSAEDIMKEMGILRPTLQLKVAKMITKDKQFYNVPGLYDEDSPLTMNTRGIYIGNSWLLDTLFRVGDTFQITKSDNSLTLTRIEK